VAASSSVEMLKRGQPNLILQQFAQAMVLDKNDTDTKKARRYERLAAATTPLTEGVTPAGSTPTITDYTATLVQYGDYLPLTDKIADTHTDPVLMQYSGMIGEQAALTKEMITYGVIKAGTNVLYANGSARTNVNTALTLNIQRKATRALKRQLGMPLTKKLSSSVNYATVNVKPAFIGLIHTDMESTIRGLAGYKAVEDYATMETFEGELGAVEDVRYVVSTVFEPFANGGGAKGTMISTGGTSADVYPVIYLAQDAFASVVLKGNNAIQPMVLNPGKISDSDKLGQRGHVGWKSYFADVILNQAWLVRAECAVVELT
jgi:N4-gp56 family major capsid protein